MQRVPTWVRWAAVAVAALAVLLVALWWFQRHLIYLPDTAAVPPAAEVIDDALDVTLTASDGVQLGAWYVPPASGAAPRATVLVANGNAGNRASRAPLARALSEQALRCCCSTTAATAATTELRARAGSRSTCGRLASTCWTTTTCTPTS